MKTTTTVDTSIRLDRKHWEINCSPYQLCTNPQTKADEIKTKLSMKSIAERHSLTGSDVSGCLTSSTRAIAAVADLNANEMTIYLRMQEASLTKNLISSKSSKNFVFLHLPTRSPFGRTSEIWSISFKTTKRRNQKRNKNWVHCRSREAFQMWNQSPMSMMSFWGQNQQKMMAI